MENRILQQKYFFIGVFTIISSFAFFSCKNFSDLSTPESISIKTDARYSVAIGENFYDELNKKLGPELMDRLNENVTGSKVYKYIPNQDDDTLQYLIQKKMYDVPLDVGEYIDNMNLNDMFSDTDNNLDFEKEITLPTINQNEEISFDLNKITDSMNIGMQSSSGSSEITIDPLPEAGSGITESLDTFLTDSGKDNKMITTFKYAKYIQFTTSSKLKITVTKTDLESLGPNYEINMTATIQEIKESETIIFHKTSTEPKNVANGGVLELPLDDGQGGKLPSGFVVLIGGTYSGGTLGNTHKYQLNFDMSDTKLKTIYDIDPQNRTPADPSDDMDMSKYDIPINQEVDLNTMDSIIKTAVLGNGALDIKVVKPDNWDKVSLNLNEFSMKGLGLNLDQGDFTNTPDTTKYLLDGVMQFENIDESKRTLDFTHGSDKKIIISGNAKVVLQNGAQIDLGENGENTTLKGNVEINVDTISKATADFSEVINFEMKEGSENEKQLSDELIKYVTEIRFGEEQNGKHYMHDKNKNLSTVEGEGLGIKCKVLNTLPPGNDIPLKIESKLFDMDSTNPEKWKDDQGASIPSGSNSAQAENWVCYSVLKFIDPITGERYKTPPYIDFNVSPLSNDITLTNLSLGATYNFGITDTEFVFDWDSADMQFASAVDPVQNEIDMEEFSIKKIMEDLGDSYKDIADNFKFNRVPVYFFIQKPTGAFRDIVGDISIKGSIQINYTNGEGVEKTEYVIGSKGSLENLNFSDEINWSSDLNTFTQDLALVNSSKEYDMKDILNDNPNGLKLKYDIILDDGKDCTIYKENLKERKKVESTSIAIEIAITLPLEFNFVNEPKIDIIKVAEFERNDLFSRDDLDTSEEYAEYADSIDYIRLYFNFENKLIDGLKADILIDDTHEDEFVDGEYTGIKKYVPLLTDESSDENYFEFSGKEMEKIMTTFFMPKISLMPKEGTVRILRSGIDEEKSFGISPVVVLQLDSDSPICITDILDK